MARNTMESEPRRQAKIRPEMLLKEYLLGNPEEDFSPEQIEQFKGLPEKEEHNLRTRLVGLRREQTEIAEKFNSDTIDRDLKAQLRHLKQDIGDIENRFVVSCLAFVAKKAVEMSHQDPIQAEALFSVGVQKLIDAVKYSYDFEEPKNKAKFITFAGGNAIRAMIDQNRRKTLPTTDIEKFEDKSTKHQEAERLKEIQEDVREALNTTRFSHQQMKPIIELRFGLTGEEPVTSLREIGEKLKIKPDLVRRLYNEGIEELKKKLSSD